MKKVQNNKAWFLVLPVFLLVAFSAIVPLMTVVNYSVQDIFDSNNAYFVGAEWYREILRDPRLHDSLLRQFGFSFAVLFIEIPLGIALAHGVDLIGVGVPVGPKVQMPGCQGVHARSSAARAPVILQARAKAEMHKREPRHGRNQ